jgi:hypothetical protein
LPESRVQRENACKINGRSPLNPPQLLKIGLVVADDHPLVIGGLKGVARQSAREVGDNHGENPVSRRV